MNEGVEKHEFQAEVNRLMDIIINSLYTDKQVFLRELVSNAADALEKARFHSVQDDSYLGDTKDLEVKIEHDPDAKTISITDTGIGMSKADLINNLGTVAKSGTTNFLEAMAEGADANLIGQFGVGFYSAFLVADKVTVTSKCNDDPVQHVWESSADASFTVVPDPRGNTLGRGSRVTLHLKEDAHDYLSEDKLKEASKKYSQFIQFPIYVKVKKEVDAEAEEDDDDDDKDEEEKDEVETKDDEEKDEEKKEEKKPTKKTVYEWEQVNTQKAIWLRAKEDVTEEEYTEFYKSISKDYLDPLAYTHFNAEGEIEFKSILYLPKKAPFDMMDNYWTKKSDVKLFVRRVLVAEKFEELLPRYLNFVRGVVDSDDLPLNVSREQLQQNKIMKVISKKLVRKVLELMKKLAKEEETGDDEDEEKDEEEKKEEKKDKADEEGTWTKFWKEFNKNLKMGCYEDDSNRSKLSKLLRFTTTKTDGKQISLDKYLDRMQESQESIYYMSGDSMEVMKKAPALQVFKKKDLEVLMLDDHLDEPCLQKLADYEGKKFVSIQKADVKLDETEDEKKRFSKIKDMYKPLTDWWKDSLTEFTEKGAMKDAGVKIEKVEVSKRLTESPVVVVTSQFGYSAQQEKVMKAQAFQNKDQIGTMSGRKTLEINPNHPVIVDLLQKCKADKEDKAAKDTAQVLFQTALIESGYELADASSLVNRVYRLMSKELGVDPDAPLAEVEVAEEEEEADEEDDKDEEEEKDEDAEGDDKEGDGDKAEL
jgi:heat shock protein beta